MAGGVLRGVPVHAQSAQRRLQPARMRLFLQRAQRPAKAQADLIVAPLPVPPPEGRLRALRARGRYDHAVAPDLRNTPRKRPKQELVADARLEDELLVQLAQARAVRERHGKPAAVGNRPAGGDGEHARIGVPADRAVQPVVQQARPHGLVPLVFKVAGQHAQQRLHLLARDLRKGIRAPRDAHGVLHRVCARRGHGHQMLREHVQAPAGRPCGLDRSRHGGVGQQAAAKRLRSRARIDAHHAHAVGPVSRAPHALHRAGHAHGASDLHDPVHLAYVDAQLHGGGRAQ